jgi:hypothetical protein
MLKELIRTDTNEASAPSCKWRNIYFGQDGRRATGVETHATQAEAEASTRECLRVCEMGKAHGMPVTINCLEGKLENFKYAWHMQMPVMEKQ